MDLTGDGYDLPTVNGSLEFSSKDLGKFFSEMVIQTSSAAMDLDSILNETEVRPPFSKGKTSSLIVRSEEHLRVLPG